LRSTIKSKTAKLAFLRFSLKVDLFCNQSLMKKLREPKTAFAPIWQKRLHLTREEITPVSGANLLLKRQLMSTGVAPQNTRRTPKKREPET
jgi:hypothetical protein